MELDGFGELVWALEERCTDQVRWEVKIPSVSSLCKFFFFPTILPLTRLLHTAKFYCTSYLNTTGKNDIDRPGPLNTDSNSEASLDAPKKQYPSELAHQSTCQTIHPRNHHHTITSAYTQSIDPWPILSRLAFKSQSILHLPITGSPSPPDVILHIAHIIHHLCVGKRACFSKQRVPRL